MSFNSFIPQIWIAELLPILENNLNFKALTNRDYEGEVRQKGDSVIINQISTPTINNYSDSSGVTFERLTTVDQTLLIDQQKYFAFDVSDIDKAQVANNGAMFTAAIKQGGYALQNAIDVAIAEKYSDAGIKAGSGNGALGTSAAPLEISANGGGSTITVTDWLGRMNRRAKEGNLPDSIPKSIIIPPWLEQKMIMAKILNARGVTNDGTYVEGEIRSAFGFNFYVSNNVQTTATTKFNIMAGNRNAITIADQITKMEAGRRESYFRDYIKSLYVYGLKTVHSDSLMLSVVTEGAN